MYMGVDFSKRAISFYNNNGLVFFNKFEALNSRMKTVKVGMTKPEPLTTIRLENIEGKELGTFDINIDKKTSTIEGRQLISYNEKEGNGQLLTLSAILELAKNKMNRLTYCSDESNVPFLAKMGFVIDTDDPRYIRRGLKQVMKSRLPDIDELKYKAKVLYPQVKDVGATLSENSDIFYRGCKVLSDYIKLIARNKYPEKYYPFMGVGTDMKFTDWELLTEKMYLNKLTEKHCLDYKF